MVLVWLLCLLVVSSLSSHRVSTIWKIRESQNFELSGMSGNCRGIFLPVTELMGKQVHFYASGLQTCPAH